MEPLKTCIDGYALGKSKQRNGFRQPRTSKHKNQKRKRVK